jgi:hypothetical protein
MICLKETLQQSILKTLHTVWSNVFLNKLDKNRNEVLFCFDNYKSEIFQENAFQNKSINSNADGNTLLLLGEISNKLKEIKF